MSWDDAGAWRVGSDALIAPMQARDVPVVAAVERACFASYWDPGAYYNELANPAAIYRVAWVGQVIAGFAGLWVAVDEAHFTLVGILPEYRRRHLALALVVTLLENAIGRGATRATLEVRDHNTAAQQLYARLGFREQGRRRGYYTDTGEDARIMWVEDIGSCSYVEMLDGIKARLAAGSEPWAGGGADR